MFFTLIIDIIFPLPKVAGKSKAPEYTSDHMSVLAEHIGHCDRILGAILGLSVKISHISVYSRESSPHRHIFEGRSPLVAPPKTVYV